MKALTLLITTALAANAAAAVTFITPDGFAADTSAGSATWNIFATIDGSQGTSTDLAGSNAPTASDLIASQVAAITPPGGILGGGESIYIHTGGLGLTPSATFGNEIDFARVSYALVDSAMGATNPFAVAPTIAGAASTGSGVYKDGVRSSVFYFDFALPAGTSSIETTFGDTPGGFSFRSVEAVRIEGLSFQPAAVPEPGAATLLGFAALGLIIRRRR